METSKKYTEQAEIDRVNEELESYLEQINAPESQREDLKQDGWVAVLTDESYQEAILSSLHREKEYQAHEGN